MGAQVQVEGAGAGQGEVVGGQTASKSQVGKSYLFLRKYKKKVANSQLFSIICLFPSVVTLRPFLHKVQYEDFFFTEYIWFLPSPIQYFTDERGNVNLFVNHFFLHPQSYILADPAHKARIIIKPNNMLQYLFMSCRAHAVLTRSNILRKTIITSIILLPQLRPT